MKIIFLLMLFLFPCFAFADDYTDIIKQAEIIKIEAESLTIKLQQLSGNNISASSTTSVSDIINNINETIKKLGQLIDAAKELTQNTNVQVTQTGEIVRSSIDELTTTMQIELKNLNFQLTVLIQSVNSTVQSTNSTIQTVNNTIQHVDYAVTNATNFINSFGGRVTTSYYFEKEGLNSSADVVLWRGRNIKEDVQYSYLRLTVDGIEDSENRQFSATVGTTRGIFSFGAGYIQDGLGVDLGLNHFGEQGIDGRLSLYRMKDLGINSELGYRPKFLNNTRLFIFGEDLLKENRNGGGGISYERNF